MIVGIVGLPGHGKSLEGVRQAGLAHARGDCHVYANVPLNLERFTLVTPVSLSQIRAGSCACKCKRVFVFLDEVHLWLPARRSLQLPVSWLALFSQTRKMGWELWWTAQHETRVDRMLRDVTAFMVLARAGLLPVEHYVYHWFPADEFRRPQARLKKDLRRRSRSACALYDTLGSVTGADHLKDAKDPYAATPVSAGVPAPGGDVLTRRSVAAPASVRPPLGEGAREVIAELLRDELVDEQPARVAVANTTQWRF